MRRSDLVTKAVFWCIILLGLIDRAHLLQITIGYASDDLTVVWMAARDYANGIFHEPFFYGQDYGVMLEALLAAPFVHFGADPIVVVPVVMAFLAMMPYWSFAFFQYIRSKPASATLIAAIPILLPVEHGLQFTNLNGLAILAVYPWVAGMQVSVRRSALIGAVLAAAAFVNMNASVTVAAFGTLFLINHAKDRIHWLWAVCGALPVLLLWWWSMQFHTIRGEHLVHTVFDWRMVFHPELIPEALTRLDAHFAWLCPLWWPNGHLVLWLLGIVMVALFRLGRKSAAWAILAALLTIFFSFGFAKIHDGTSSILFPLSRMFLAVPLLLGWSLALLEPYGRIRPYLVPIIGVASVITFSLRYEQALSVWAKTLTYPEGAPIHMREISKVRLECKTLMRYAQETSAELLVVIRNPNVGEAFFMNMGCPVCEPGLPSTYMPGGDWRAWRVREESSMSRQRILVVGGDPAIWANAMNGPFDVQVTGTGKPLAHMVTGADLPVDTLMLRLGFTVGR
jgi:hypothetical protein